MAVSDLTGCNGMVQLNKAPLAYRKSPLHMEKLPNCRYISTRPRIVILEVTFGVLSAFNLLTTFITWLVSFSKCLSRKAYNQDGRKTQTHKRANLEGRAPPHTFTIYNIKQKVISFQEPPEHVIKYVEDDISIQEEFRRDGCTEDD
mmetsp:Transcript_32729/g.54842  ORF Transcript_32729/g.54842 Transcript_32729/m.54842 type:complete len:146 (+) Transcript_32729:218-655(+)